MLSKELIVVGGPNGSGKSTFIGELLLARPMPYFSADLIATEFPSLDPVSKQLTAGREFIRRVDEQLSEESDFVIETTMSGRTLQHFIRKAAKAGFSISIFFVYLDRAETCIVRVSERVRRGGHDVPVDDIRRRFNRCFANFWQLYRQIADDWYVVYNSGGEFRWVASGESNAVVIHDDFAYQAFLQLAGVADDQANS